MIITSTTQTIDHTTDTTTMAMDVNLELSEKQIDKLDKAITAPKAFTRREGVVLDAIKIPIGKGYEFRIETVNGSTIPFGYGQRVIPSLYFDNTCAYKGERFNSVSSGMLVSCTHGMNEFKIRL